MSFGYTGGDGTGTDQSLTGRFVASRYENDSGVPVVVTSVDLLLVHDAIPSGYSGRVAIYSDYNGFPQVRLAYSDVVSALTVGTNSFPFSGGTVEIPAGVFVWVLYRGNNISFDGSTAAGRARWENSVAAVTDSEWAIAPWMEPLDRILPVTVNGGGTAGASNLREALIVTEPVSEGEPSVRETFAVAEPVSEGVPNVRETLIVMEPLSEATDHDTDSPWVRMTLIVAETLHPVPPELPMSTEPFPGFGNSTINPTLPAGADPFNTALPGLTFSVHKKPTFKTKVSEATSGAEVRNALMQYPRWDFELEYEFLEDRTGADSSLKTIMGFFLQRQGSFDSWLFKDPDDYIEPMGYCGIADGSVTEYPFCRTLGGFVEKVGQVDTANDIKVYLKLDGEAQAIPVTPGPYTVTVTEAADFMTDFGVTKGGIPMTKVVGAPAASQYSVNEVTGVYTFNATDQGDAILISYSYEVDAADYTVTMPNLFVFDTAPDNGSVYAAFQYFFACRFLEDEQDYEKFMDKLWSLQECTFRSIIQ